jgi:ABC-type uncharacterized transport system permease subunit
MKSGPLRTRSTITQGRTVAAALMLGGRFTGADLWLHLGIGGTWVVLLVAANRIAFARGVRRYSAFGG